MNHPENNLISLQTDKEVKRLYKTFLELIEDIRNDHEVMVKKVAESCGPEVARNVDYFTQEKYEHVRKRVLDSGNETARQLLNLLDFYDFTINKEKLEAAVNQRKVVKKFVTSRPLTVE